jgi:Nucleotidyl transferase AbiEii toxin, Type IV TA system
LTADLGASVRQRLLNHARAQERPFQELLQYYAMERFLYRLSKFRHAETFILKGALLLAAWRAPLSRATRDIDLLGRTSNDLEHIRALFAQLCDIESEPDGIEFDSKSVKVARIKEDAI